MSERNRNAADRSPRAQESTRWSQPSRPRWPGRSRRADRAEATGQPLDLASPEYGPGAGWPPVDGDHLPTYAAYPAAQEFDGSQDPSQAGDAGHPDQWGRAVPAEFNGAATPADPDDQPGPIDPAARSGRTPDVRRPRGGAWRRLEHEGVVWEGQVIIMGAEVDLAARLIVTTRRAAIVRSAQVALDIERRFLQPAPLILPDGTVALAITYDGEATEDLFLQVRDGRHAAGQLVRILGGSPRPVRLPQDASPSHPTDAADAGDPAFFAEPTGGAMPPLLGAAGPDPAQAPPTDPRRAGADPASAGPRGTGGGRAERDRRRAAAESDEDRRRRERWDRNPRPAPFAPAGKPGSSPSSPSFGAQGQSRWSQPSPASRRERDRAARLAAQSRATQDAEAALAQDAPNLQSQFGRDSSGDAASADQSTQAAPRHPGDRGPGGNPPRGTPRDEPLVARRDRAAAPRRDDVFTAPAAAGVEPPAAGRPPGTRAWQPETGTRAGHPIQHGEPTGYGQGGQLSRGAPRDGLERDRQERLVRRDRLESVDWSASAPTPPASLADPFARVPIRAAGTGARPGAGDASVLFRRDVPDGDGPSPATLGSGSARPAGARGGGVDMTPPPPIPPSEVQANTANHLSLAAAKAMGRDADWNLAPQHSATPRADHRRHRLEWLGRIFGIFLLLALTGATIFFQGPDLGRDDDGDDRLAALETGETSTRITDPLPSPTAPLAVATEPGQEIAAGTQVFDASAARTALALGVGGPSGPMPTDPPATEVAQPTTPVTPTATTDAATTAAQAPVVDTAAPSPTATPDPTSTATVAPPTPTSDPTSVPVVPADAESGETPEETSDESSQPETTEGESRDEDSVTQPTRGDQTETGEEPEPETPAETEVSDPAAETGGASTGIAGAAGSLADSLAGAAGGQTDPADEESAATEIPIATEPPAATLPPTPTATTAPEPTATNTPEPTATATHTPEPTATDTPEPTATTIPEPTATATNTPEPTATATNTPEPTATNTPEPTATATPEPTATATNTPEPTATDTPVPTATATNTPEPTATATATPAPTATNTPVPTATEAPTVTETPVPTATATTAPEPTPTTTPEPPTATATFEIFGPVFLPTETPVAPTATPETATATATATATSAPTATTTTPPTATATSDPTATATLAPVTVAPEPPPTSSIPAATAEATVTAITRIPANRVVPTDPPADDAASPPAAETAVATETPDATAEPTGEAEDATAEPASDSGEATAEPTPDSEDATREPDAAADAESQDDPTSEPIDAVDTPEPTEIAVSDTDPRDASTILDSILTPEAADISAMETPDATATSGSDEAVEANELDPASPGATPAADATIPVQDATLELGQEPLQVAPVGSFRYSIETAVRGTFGIPELGLPASAYGDWVALVVTATNWSDSQATLSLPDFALDLDDGLDEAFLDSGTGVIAANVPGAETYGSTDQATIGAGESERFLLLYLVPPAVADVDLRIDGQELDLSPAFESAVPIASLGAAPADADLLEATVTEVIDAYTIEVEVDGVRQLVRYLGIKAPTGADCFAAEATAANEALVAGETVWLERQRSDADRQGRLLRDVWVVGNAAGDLVLVSEQLVGAGAAESATTMPNTRLRGWLDAAQAVAERAGSGIWEADCAAERAAAETSAWGTGETIAGSLPFLLGLAWVGHRSRPRLPPRPDDPPMDGPV